jgi:hypothetical protein
MRVELLVKRVWGLPGRRLTLSGLACGCSPLHSRGGQHVRCRVHRSPLRPYLRFRRVTSCRVLLSIEPHSTIN